MVKVKSQLSTKWTRARVSATLANARGPGWILHFAFRNRDSVKDVYATGLSSHSPLRKRQHHCRTGAIYTKRPTLMRQGQRVRHSVVVGTVSLAGRHPAMHVWHTLTISENTAADIPKTRSALWRCHHFARNSLDTILLWCVCTQWCSQDYARG